MVKFSIEFTCILYIEPFMLILYLRPYKQLHVKFACIAVTIFIKNFYICMSFIGFCSYVFYRRSASSASKRSNILELPL